ncbi:MAG: DNA phosphorothioation system sulfurtransferase DndC [Bacteroidales bacterium]|nr:DNA phosphorothioation system sulfurtransferase DndC [Bacteroidales bacterium]
MKNDRFDNIINEIVDQYAYADNTQRPWIIGFSGGKDSTVLLTLVWKALVRIKETFPFPFQLRRQIYVVCNDTMVENPIITEYVFDVLRYIERAAKEQDLPIFVKTTTPKLEDSFWVNVLGKGYPVPNSSFRFCTEKLKIKPTSKFILDQVDEMGEAIVLIGTRSSESASRAKSIKKHEIKGRRLTKHPLNPNTFTYAPIKELLLEEIWYLINSFPSPWGYDNSRLFQIYSDASADDYECPTLVTNKDHSSCGQSRFGCWICTVVKEDKSMRALISNGFNWLQPLLTYRNDLNAGRNVSENRRPERRNGQNAVDETGHNQGNYTDVYRAKMLRKLLETQKLVQETKPHIELISSQELIAIQVTWYRDGIFDFKVSDIYSSVYGREIFIDNMKFKEKIILEEICQSNPQDYHLINDLLSLQRSKTILMNNYGLQSDLENRLIKAYKLKK